MSDGLSPTPAYTDVSAYLTLHDAAAALDWYQRAFDARLGQLLQVPGGPIAYAELFFGNHRVLVCEEADMFQTKGPKTYEGSPVLMHVYVSDADALCERAVREGAQWVKQVEDQFFGDRAGTIRDPYGYSWIIATKVRDMTHEEVQAVWYQMMNDMMGGSPE